MLPEGAKYEMCIRSPYPGDLLTEALKVAGTWVGVIAIDLATRRRRKGNAALDLRLVAACRIFHAVATLFSYLDGEPRSDHSSEHSGR